MTKKQLLIECAEAFEENCEHEGKLTSFAILAQRCRAAAWAEARINQRRTPASAVNRMTSEDRSSNLVVELRKWYGLKGATCFREAADEIERLRARECEAFRLANAATYLVPQKYALHGELVAFMNGQITAPADEPSATPSEMDEREDPCHPAYVAPRLSEPPSDVQRDAERYRWLRRSVSNPVYCAFSGQYGVAMLHGESLDTIVDEARAAVTKEAAHAESICERCDKPLSTHSLPLNRCADGERGIF